MGWTFVLADVRTDTTLADLTSAVSSATISPRLNRPLSQIWTVAADNALIRATAFDGDRNLVVGTRCMKAYRNGTLRGNCEVWTIEYGGDENTETVTITGHDPLQQLLSRTAFDDTGSLADPTFASPITGADLIQDVLTNTVTYEDNLGTPRILPIDFTTGTFATTVDLSAALTDWPMTIGDLISLIVDTGVVDVTFKPVDTSMGFPAGVLAQLSVVDQAGADLTASVHFDYATGSYNVAQIRRSFDLSSLCNRLTYELGPPRGAGRWAGNITGTELTPVDLSTPWQANQLASRAKYGTFANVKIYDSQNENDDRPLWHQLWKTESTLRVNPRELLYITPASDNLFAPFDGYNPGDLVGVNSADIAGPQIVNQPLRIYGYDVTVDQDGREQVGELLASADQE